MIVICIGVIIPGVCLRVRTTPPMVRLSPSINEIHLASNLASILVITGSPVVLVIRVVTVSIIVIIIRVAIRTLILICSSVIVSGMVVLDVPVDQLVTRIIIPLISVKWLVIWRIFWLIPFVRLVTLIVIISVHIVPIVVLGVVVR